MAEVMADEANPRFPQWNKSALDCRYTSQVVRKKADAEGACNTSQRPDHKRYTERQAMSPNITATADVQPESVTLRGVS